MDMMNMAQQLISKKLGDSIDADTIASALGSLTGASDGNFNISTLISSISGNSDMMGMLGSWLGDGENASIDAGGVSQIFSADQLSGFASKLGLDAGSASSLLADVVPNIIDQSSSGGSMLDSVGGVDSALNMAKKFF